ncbi:MAG: chemotaxis protein methyltransferase CheR [Alphaproteobacteria bacterium]|jgi:chemotaxis protein methyltransferase CheR|nr:chemotaxis protein methyltransferase CheR [Alphaproteobacteria bacterium]
MTYSDKLTPGVVRDVFAGREFPFTHRDFQQIADMMNKDAGIALAEAKAPLVYSRLVKRLRNLGIESFKQYCELVQGERGIEERQQMVASLTTNVTRFFREPHHFEHLKAHVLPDLLNEARRGARLRIWSAGCSTGEEPYSIALTILSMMRDATRFDIKILATDINKRVLAHAQQGTYGDAALRPVSREQRSDWFVRGADTDGEKNWSVGNELRALVTFRELNLMADWPMKQAYQAVFCRNVVIYFEEHVRSRIWDGFATLMTPAGWLYIGHSERISLAGPFELKAYTTYRRKGSQGS